MATPSRDSTSTPPHRMSSTHPTRPPLTPLWRGSSPTSGRSTRWCPRPATTRWCRSRTSHDSSCTGCCACTLVGLRNITRSVLPSMIATGHRRDHRDHVGAGDRWRRRRRPLRGCEGRDHRLGPQPRGRGRRPRCSRQRDRTRTHRHSPTRRRLTMACNGIPNYDCPTGGSPGPMRSPKWSVPAERRQRFLCRRGPLALTAGR